MKHTAIILDKFIKILQTEKSNPDPNKVTNVNNNVPYK